MEFCKRSENVHGANELVKNFQGLLHHSSLEKKLHNFSGGHILQSYITPSLQKSEKFVIVQLIIDVCTLNVKNALLFVQSH